MVAGPTLGRLFLTQGGTPMSATYDSAADLVAAFRRAEEAHGPHEEETGQPDAKWPDWHAAYMEQEQAGRSGQTSPSP